MYKFGLNCKLDIRDCGIEDYGRILKLQEELCVKRQRDEIENTILMVEHPAVITCGARKTENKLLVTEDELTAKNIQLHVIGRGGGTTMHNPGQLVVYPVIKLRSLKMGVSDYIRILEAIGIEFLDQLGIKAKRKKGYPGLWIDNKKIGSIGVQIKRWVTMHGMAININNDLSIFDNIVPCGLKDVTITNVLNETGVSHSMDKLKEIMSSLCTKAFSTRELTA